MEHCVQARRNPGRVTRIGSQSPPGCSTLPPVHATRCGGCDALPTPFIVYLEVCWRPCKPAYWNGSSGSAQLIRTVYRYSNSWQCCEVWKGTQAHSVKGAGTWVPDDGVSCVGRFQCSANRERGGCTFTSDGDPCSNFRLIKASTLICWIFFTTYTT